MESDYQKLYFFTFTLPLFNDSIAYWKINPSYKDISQGKIRNFSNFSVLYEDSIKYEKE